MATNGVERAFHAPPVAARLVCVRGGVRHLFLVNSPFSFYTGLPARLVGGLSRVELDVPFVTAPSDLPKTNLKTPSKGLKDVHAMWV